MKKLFNINLIVLVLSTNVIQVYGQWNNNFPCTNGVNTNPNNPTNNGLPTLPNGSSDTRFLNKFDWIHGNDTWIDPVDGSVNHTYQTQDTVYFTPTAGTYRVKGPHLVDSFDVTFWATPSLGGFSYSYKILNYDGLGSSCEDPNADIDSFTFRQTWLRNVGFPCNYFRGDIHRRLDGVTQMNFKYSLDGTSSTIVERTYYGRKLN